MIKAKTIVPNEYWVINKDNKKIGTVQQVDGEYQVTVNNSRAMFPSISLIKNKIGLEFEDAPKFEQPDVIMQVHGYPTDAHAFNGIYDIRQKLPLYTKEGNSKSWFCAGYYLVKQGRKWKTQFCPKLITLQRYEFIGPKFTQDDLLLQ